MNGNESIKTFGDFWQDTAACWERLPNKAFFFILLAAWVALFQFLGNSILGYVHTPSLFQWMYNMYENPAGDDGHGLFIPILVFALFWWKRRELLDSRLQLWMPGLILVIVAMALHILAYIIQEPYFSIVSLFTGIYGLMGMAWGPEWLRKSIFPFFLFVFSVPLGQHAAIITFPLQMLVTWLVTVISHFLGIGVIRLGTQLIDPSGAYQYDVQPACAGIRSLVANFLLATVYGFFTFRSTWKRLLIMSLALPFAILGNLLRLLMVIFTAEMGGQKWGDYVHDNFFTSLMPYVPAFVGLILVGSWLEKREAGNTGKQRQVNEPSRPPAQFRLEKGEAKAEPNEK
jgi:exosortase